MRIKHKTLLPTQWLVSTEGRLAGTGEVLNDEYRSTIRDLTGNTYVELAVEVNSEPLTIDWGDGTPAVRYNNTNTVSHTYATPGEYILTLSGAIQSFPTKTTTVQKNTLVDILSWGDELKILNYEKMFQFCTRIVDFTAPDAPNLKGIQSLAHMFDVNAGSNDHPDANFNFDISHWDVSDVRHWHYFANGTKTQPIVNFPQLINVGYYTDRDGVQRRGSVARFLSHVGDAPAFKLVVWPGATLTLMYYYVNNINQDWRTWEWRANGDVDVRNMFDRADFFDVTDFTDKWPSEKIAVSDVGSLGRIGTPSSLWADGYMTVDDPNCPFTTNP